MGAKIIYDHHIIIIYFFLFISTIISFSGCANNGEPEEPVIDKNKYFGIYLLEDQSISWEDMKNKNIDSLKLKEWLTGDKISFYDYSSHVIYLNVDYSTLFSVPHNSNSPFVVVANNRRCYYGRFTPPDDSTQPNVVIKPLELCSDLVMLEFNPPQRKDIRENDYVKQALISAGIYKPGLGHMMRDSMNTRKVLGDTLRLFMGINSNNLEDSSLYLPYSASAPVKVGSHIYRTKAVLYNHDTYYCEYAKQPWLFFQPFDIENNIFVLTPVDPSESYKNGPTWYSYFPLKNLPDGEYYCYIEYYGAMGAPKDKRNRPEGRMWIGYVRTNTVLLDYNSAKGVTIKNKNVILD